MRKHIYCTFSAAHPMVIDPESGKTVADIPSQKRAHGVAIVPQAGRGFISDGGGDGAAVIFDLTTNAVWAPSPHSRTPIASFSILRVDAS